MASFVPTLYPFLSLLAVGNGGSLGVTFEAVCNFPSFTHGVFGLETLRGESFQKFDDLPLSGAGADAATFVANMDKSVSGGDSGVWLVI